MGVLVAVTDKRLVEFADQQYSYMMKIHFLESVNDMNRAFDKRWGTWVNVGQHTWDTLHVGTFKVW